MIELALQHVGQLREIAKQRGVRRPSLFGSVLTEQFDPTRSDIDVLVEFESLAPVEPRPWAQPLRRPRRRSARAAPRPIALCRRGKNVRAASLWASAGVGTIRAA